MDVVSMRAAEQAWLMRAEARADAFRRLLEVDLLRYYAIAGAMLGDAVDAQDAVHDAAVSAWQHFGELRDEARFAAWFDRILVNQCRDRLRARRRHPIVELGAGGGIIDEPSIGDRSTAIAASDAVERAMRTLDADHIAVVVLRFEADLTVPAIAERLGIAEGTVKSRLHHALQRMRSAIDGQGEGR
ncbi:MAG: sigma-70 family RNA polymerase sigma factor [Chloroflexota bacterium]